MKVNDSSAKINEAETKESAISARRKSWSIFFTQKTCGFKAFDETVSQILDTFKPNVVSHRRKNLDDDIKECNDGAVRRKNTS
jgi:hypothetical protein